MAWRLRSLALWDSVAHLCRQERYDAVHVEGIEMAPYGLLALKSGCATLTYDAHNAEYLLQRRAFTTDVADARKLPRALYSLVQWWRLLALEREVCLRSAHILSVSEADSRALARIAPLAATKITVLPNGVDTVYWSPGAISPSSITLPANSVVFDGTMDFRPNVDAALWFVRYVWPLIRREMPDAQFYIVGRNPAPQVLALAAAPGVVVTGAVDDTRPYVAQASVYVVPMRMGGGVRLKFLQALSMERAVVSTPMGAEGVGITAGKEVILSRSPEAFAGAVTSLLNNPARREQIGAAARSLVYSRYAWPSLLPTLDRLYPPQE